MQSTSGPSLSLAAFEQVFEEVKNWGRWGPDDDRGALNSITPERTRAASNLVRSGRTVSLAADLDKLAGPDNPRPVLHFMTSLGDTSKDEPRFAADFFGMECHGDAHSHIDALNHCVFRGKLYNGIPASTVSSAGGPAGAITVARHGIVSRGVLLDIPRLRGVHWLEPGEVVVTEDLEAAERAQQVRLGEGDILLLRTGHARRRLELGPWEAAFAKAGLHPYAMRLLHARGIAAAGFDGDGDVIPHRVEGISYPIHCLGINAMGLHFMDSLNFEDLALACEAEQRWEFLCVIAPLRLGGGTGTAVNPIAIF
ncbi:MAG: cyclase family protein [Chloroflexi bacterium]|nr:cyclase family protein [Chloroflexota bacterium]